MTAVTIMSADTRKIRVMRGKITPPLYHEATRGPGDFPGPRFLLRWGLEGVADPRRHRRDVLHVGVRTVDRGTRSVHVGRRGRVCRREGIPGSGASTDQPVLVVPDGEVRGQPALAVVGEKRVEVVDTDGRDFAPASPPLSVGADRLEVVEVLTGVTHVLVGLVSARVREATLDEQRTRAPTPRHVEEVRAHRLPPQVPAVAERTETGCH